MMAAANAPASTEAIRQPKGVKPKTRMPPAINHFPRGGCLTWPCSMPKRSRSLASGA